MNDAKLLKFRAFKEPNGTLVPLTAEKDIPFAVRRVFYIYDTGSDVVRGEHAHQECHQLLVCLRGTCEVRVDDGVTQAEYTLSSPEQGLHIPPTLWARQRYVDDTCLVVFANLPFDEKDYIRDHDAYLAYRGVPRRKSA